jgi:type III restriction enzyme
MKLHFEPDLDYQHAAIEAAADLFRGQEICRTEFTVTYQVSDEPALGIAEEYLGIGNRLQLLDDQILENLRAVQLRNGLPPSGTVNSKALDFTVEMETGTGKTYVYLRTIFELNRRYGFTKFVVVVPSVAIKEGVYKTLQMTEEHFRALYANVPFEYFLYDSSKLGQVRNFATSANVQIMVVTVGAINKTDVNNIYKESEKTGGEKPIDLIRATRPIVIVDEPQSVDGGLKGSGKKALDDMRPLCTLRYSATHADRHHPVYRLDAVDAYERKLVKQIEVASLLAEGGHNTPYVRVLGVSNKKGGFTARLELDVETKGRVERTEKVVRPGDDLQQVSGRSLYADWLVLNIDCKPGQEGVELSALESPLRVGQSVGGVDEDQLRRLMIRRTITEHLDKELRLAPLQIKVLSLFFIDAVEHYRRYENGVAVKGKYATMFEEEYRRVAVMAKYRSLFKEVDLASDAFEVHEGYFSIDKKGGWVDTGESNATGREAAERAYALIMRDKEKLLSFDTKLKFIFSHSALREGWDNPNVFQICTLREIGTERERRQTIGRGLRLCVDQMGQRRRGFDINTLTVVATESYEEFAAGLQHEIEQDTGIRFGIVEKHAFAGVSVAKADGEPVPLGFDLSDALWRHLRDAGYVDANGKVQDSLRAALKAGSVKLPESFEAQRAQIAEVLRKAAGRLEIKNADERRTIPLRAGVLDSPEFQALWERIKHKTTYRVHFDNEKLIRDCISAIEKLPPIPGARVRTRVGQLDIAESGITTKAVSESAPVAVEEANVELPDVLTVLQDATQLTRRSIARILIESARLDDFKRNPQQYIALVTEAINRTKRLALVDGIKYLRLGDSEYYAQELFEREELTGYIRNVLSDTKRSIYESVVYDSGVERSFAEALEINEAVKLYAKLPGWFQVPTPLGSYNPDWAVVVEKDGEERCYFVVETKGGLFTDDLRAAEGGKIECGKAHFRAIGASENPARYLVANDLDTVLTSCVT